MDRPPAQVAAAPASPGGEAFDAQLRRWQQRVEQALRARLPAADAVPARLHAALRDSVLNSGNRLHAALVFAAAQVAGAGGPEVDAAACAVELAHAGARIHEALPPLGAAGTPPGLRPCHEAYDQATALLAGDALLPLAIRLLAGEPSPSADPAVRLRLVALLAEASGSLGTVGDQALQLAARAESPAAMPLADVPQRGSGALARASVMMGTACARSGDPLLRESLQRFSAAIGCAVRCREAYPPGAGDAASQALARASREAMHQALAPLGEAAVPLRQIAGWVLAARA